MPQLRRFPPIDQDLAEDDQEDDSDSPGGLLAELERRQDDVIARLDELNARIEAVLLGLGVKLDEEPVAGANYS